MPMSVVKKQQQLSLRELYQMNWFLGAGMALLACWPAFSLEFNVMPHVLAAVILIGVSIIRPQIPAFVPKPVWQAIPFLLVILLAVDLRFSPEPVPALIRLNVLLVLFRCLAFRRKREDLQLIVLCLFLLIIAGVSTVALAFIVQIVAFTAIAMVFLFNITLMENSRETLVPKEIWRDFTWHRFLAKIWSRGNVGSCVVAGLTFGSVIVCSILLFLLIPRFDLNNPIPFLGMNRASETGFSESISFGDVTDIKNNDSVALRVEVAAGADVPQDPYWRMLVLDEYVGGGFQVSRAVMHNHRGANKVREVDRRDSLIDSPVRPEAENLWTFYLEGGVARYMPLTGIFDNIRFQDTQDLVYMPPSRVLGGTRVNSSMLVYRVRNMEVNGVFPDPEFGKYNLEYDFYPELDPRYAFEYMNYPDTTVALPPREEDRAYLKSLVEEIGQGEALTVAEFAARATRYIQERHSYSMSYSIPPGDNDHVVRWLQSGEPGHCEVFAGSLLLICRAAGIPARIVTGFRGGTWNGYENYFMVRNSDAHAWVELFDGKDSWLRFDPTPGGSSVGSPEEGGDERMADLFVDSSFGAYMDSLRILWYRRIVSFDQESQFELWNMIQETYGRIELKEWLAEAGEAISAWWKEPWSVSRLIDLLWLLGVGGLLALLVTFCLREDRMFLFSRNGKLSDPVRRKAGRQLQRLENLCSANELEEPQRDVFEQIQLDLQKLRYGPPKERSRRREILKQARRFARSLR